MFVFRSIFYFVTFFLLQATFHDNVSCDEQCHEVLEKTLIDEKLNGLDQEDPILIEAVKARLIEPPASNVKYVFSDPANIRLEGQFDQAKIVSQLFGDKRDGFFIEAGAFDGEIYSNSLYFEANLGWKGLLVEANPDNFDALKTKNRKSHLFGHCISLKTTAEVVDFDAAGLIGGIIQENEKLPGDVDPFYIDQRARRNRPKNYKSNTRRRNVRMQCFPLYSMLLALGNPTVDIFSLDIEGGELQVLETIPWKKVNMSVLIIEVGLTRQLYTGPKYEIRKLLEKEGYLLYDTTLLDDIYIKSETFKTIKRRKLLL